MFPRFCLFALLAMFVPCAVLAQGYEPPASSTFEEFAPPANAETDSTQFDVWAAAFVEGRHGDGFSDFVGGGLVGFDLWIMAAQHWAFTINVDMGFGAAGHSQADAVRGITVLDAGVGAGYRSDDDDFRLTLSVLSNLGSDTEFGQFDSKGIRGSLRLWWEIEDSGWGVGALVRGGVGWVARPTSGADAAFVWQAGATAGATF